MAGTRSIGRGRQNERAGRKGGSAARYQDQSHAFRRGDGLRIAPRRRNEIRSASRRVPLVASWSPGGVESEDPQERAWGGGVGTRECRVTRAVSDGPLPGKTSGTSHLGRVAARVSGWGKSSRSVFCSSDGCEGGCSGGDFFWRATAILRHISQGYSPPKVISAASMRLRSWE